MKEPRLSINRYAPDFELPGTDGAVHHLSRYLETFRAVGVVMLSHGCPQVRLYLDRLKQIQADFQAQGFTLIGINANDDRQFPEDSLTKMKTFLSDYQLNFPYLRDMTQEVAQGFAAEKMSEVFLIDRSGLIQYRGAIDDNPQDAAFVKTPYLRQATTQLLSGIEVFPRSIAAVGSSVTWRT